MRGFAAYQTYLAIMMHFNEKSNYDYFQYNGKTRATIEKFKDDKQKVFKFGGIEKRVGVGELETFFFVNMEKEGYRAFVPQLWYKSYKNQLAILNDSMVSFEDDINHIVDIAKHEGCTYKDLFCGGDFHLHPLLYVWYDKGIISRFTMLFIDAYIESIFDESHSNDPLLWTEVVDRHRIRVGFYRRCYFSRLQSKDEMIKIGQTQLNNILGNN
jgi:hypothetical protein